MNWKQKTCLWIGIAAIVAMGVYPPWKATGQGSVVGFARWGYSYIMNPPNKFVRIDTSRLYIQWLMVTVVTGGLIVTFKDKKPKDE